MIAPALLSHDELIDRLRQEQAQIILSHQAEYSEAVEKSFENIEKDFCDMAKQLRKAMWQRDVAIGVCICTTVAFIAISALQQIYR